ncbi:hypothetical protein FHQ13_027320 (plasmid) [Bacillus cereus]|uniref:hypothetical protein n=1 Tax=Bacillus cereus TaxID=1396 RepID=UPI00111DCEFF|nr:hypothetical protein [Bacillus cereus]UDW03772.1 hypothetical protein FHQ13_027320 [Bacillus cereus]
MATNISDFVGKGSSLLFNFPLYTKIRIDLVVETRSTNEVIDFDDEFGPTFLDHTKYIEGKDFRFLKNIFLNEHNFYCFCPICKRDMNIVSSNYKEIKDIKRDEVLTIGTNINSIEEDKAYEQHALEKMRNRASEFYRTVFGESNSVQLNFHCTSKHQHKMYVNFHITEDGYLVKTGQFPSIMEFDSCNDVDDIFGKDAKSKKDFRTATILKSHDYGVAAFLYLRRIFERLISEKAESAKNEEMLNIEEFEKKKMQEKVKCLHDLGLVSDYLNENKTFIYGILSKGLHQLTEKECLANYDPLKESIVLMIKENNELQKRERLKKEINRELNSIHSKMNDN